MRFRVAGIPASLAAEVRQTQRSPQYGHPAYRETATGYGPCERYDARVFPPDFRRLPLLLEACKVGGELLGRERVRDQSPEAVLERLFAAAGAAYVHVRNEEAGCFMARVDRS